MTIILGNLAICGALLAAGLALLTSLASLRFDRPSLLGASRRLMGAVAALLTVAGLALLAALADSDFRLAYVAQFTERALPIGYKLSAFWAGQEGSLLLWGWLLAVLSVLLAIVQRKQFGTEPAAVMATLAVICGFFAALLLLAANPFRALDEVPADGHGLNPLLQDPGMIWHPPTLFVGYAGFAIPFAMLVGALIVGRRDQQWILATRRWLLVSWAFLTVGIILGAKWAYVELGWGGYWAWDPVENASLLPWLTATALLHSIMAQQHRGVLLRWNAALIVLSFLLCIFGTYITRSGVVQSVHSFGKSLVGSFFLAFLVAGILFSATLLLARRRLLHSGQAITSLLSREGAFMLTNVLLLIIMLITLLGTIFPLLSQIIMGRSVQVGPPFYNKVVVPMSLLLVGLMGVAPLLSYGKPEGKQLWRTALAPVLLAVVACAAALTWGIRSPWALLATAIVALGAASLVLDLLRTWAQRMRWAGENVLLALLRVLDGNHRRYGGQVVHVGMLLFMLGVAGSSIYHVKRDLKLHPGQSATVGAYNLTFTRLDEARAANYTAVQAPLKITDTRGQSLELVPQRRFYDKSEQSNSEVAIHSTWKEDLYIILAGWEAGGSATAFQVIISPLVGWLWIGGYAMVAGALLCLLPALLPSRQAAAAPAELRLARA